MARQQEHSAPSELQIIPGTTEETYERILRGKLQKEEDLPTIVDQLKSMFVRRSEFECVQAEVETLKVEGKTLKVEGKALEVRVKTLQTDSGTLRADLETLKKRVRGIGTRDFVQGVIRQTSSIDQRELIFEHERSASYTNPQSNPPGSSNKSGVLSGQAIQIPKLTVEHFAPLWTCYNKSAHDYSIEEVHALIDESLWNYEFFQEWIHQRSRAKISFTKDEFKEYATSVSPSDLSHMLELQKKNSPYALLVATYYLRIKYSLPDTDAKTRAPFETLDISWSDIHQKALALELKKRSNLRDFCRSIRYTLFTTPYDVQPYCQAISLLNLFALKTKYPRDLLKSFEALERTYNIDSRRSPSNSRSYHTLLNRKPCLGSAKLFCRPSSLSSAVRRPSARRPWPSVKLIGPNQSRIRSLSIRALNLL